MQFQIEGQTLDSVELKCLVVSHGLKIDKRVYKECGPKYRINTNALTCNCFKLFDSTIVMATDLAMHLSTLSSMFSWDNLKLIKYMGDMKSDFTLEMRDGQVALCYKGQTTTPIQFMEHTEFYQQKTTSGMPFMGNAVLQGCDWVAFQCLWPCDFARAGKPCQYCFTGGQQAALESRGKPMPRVPSPADVAEVVNWAIDHGDANSIQITGGSTFSGKTEACYITSYLKALHDLVGKDKIAGEILLYITPPEDLSLIDRYFELGVDRIACSLEVWDDKLAEEITPGKRAFTGKQRHLDALCYIAEKYGPNKAFSNFIIGLEPLESLRQGATYLAERGIIPSASVWMPFGKPVRGSMKAPGLDWFRTFKEMYADIYERFNLSPAGNCGLNVCVEKDIWRYVHEGSHISERA